MPTTTPDQDKKDAAEAGEAERDRLAALVYVPGRWRCAKCNFGLQQFKIRACDGAIGENDKTGEKCPNCDVPLWRVTEREAGNEISERAEEYLKRAVSAERALAKAREALVESLVELRFVRTFVCSSQQIQQPTGLGLYDECVAKVAGTIVEISASIDRATPYDAEGVWMPTTTPDQDKKDAADLLALLTCLRDWAEGKIALKIETSVAGDSKTIKVVSIRK